MDSVYLGVTVDYQVLFNIAATLTAFLGGWVLNSITTNIRTISADLKALDLAHQKTREEYVPKSEHVAELGKLEHRFDRIDDKLDRIVREISTKT